MSRSWIRSLSLSAVAGLVLVSAAAAQDATGPADILVLTPPSGDVLVPAPVAVPATEGGLFAFAQANAVPVEVHARLQETETAPASEYWIGVQLEPLPELIVSHLKLERGMVVVQVFEGSPAAKAEFKVNDIILRAAGTDVKEPGDLISAVSEAKDKEIEVLVLRSGTETTLKVTPAKRQSDQLEFRVSPETPHVRVVEALENLYKRSPDGDVRLFAVRPGGVYAYAQTAKFPDNLEVTIEKRGDQPTKIRVKRAQEGKDQEWEVTEEKVGELPEDIRVHVQQMLGGQPPMVRQALSLRLDPNVLDAQRQAARAQDEAKRAQERAEHTLKEYRLKVQPLPGTVRSVPVAPPVPTPPITVVPRGDQSIQAKLDAILKKLDQPQSDALQRLQAEVERLRKEVEELRQDKK